MTDLLFHLGAIAVIVFSAVLWFIFCMIKIVKISDDEILGFVNFDLTCDGYGCIYNPVRNS